MGNTLNRKFFIFILLLSFFHTQISVMAQDKKKPDTKKEKTDDKEENEKIKKELKKIEVKEKSDPGVHFKMLKRLKIDDVQVHESKARRAEITFWIGFGYTWMFQVIIYDTVLRSKFNEKEQQDELIDRNLFFAVATSFIIGLFISRNDLQHYIKKRKGHFYNYYRSSVRSYDRTRKGYNWYFDFLSWEF